MYAFYHLGILVISQGKGKIQVRAITKASYQKVSAKHGFIIATLSIFIKAGFVDITAIRDKVKNKQLYTKIMHQFFIAHG